MRDPGESVVALALKGETKSMNCELTTSDIESILATLSELAKRGDIRVTIEHTAGGYRASMHTFSKEEERID